MRYIQASTIENIITTKVSCAPYCTQLVSRMLHEMGLIQLYSTPKTSSGVNDPSQTTSSRCHNTENSSFCRCERDVQKRPLQKSKWQMNSSASQSPDALVRRVYLNAPRAEKYRPQVLSDTCRCGEDTCRIINWTWDKENLQPQTIINNHTVQFHPIYSQGRVKIIQYEVC